MRAMAAEQSGAPIAAERSRVLVTGASGFLGRHLAAALARRGFRVRGLVRATSAALPLEAAGVEVFRGDLAAPRAVAAAVDGARIVLHCAARVSDWGSRAEFWHTNVLGTRHVAEACRVAGVERLVHVSTLTVLGLPRDGRIVDETTPCAPHPADLYTETKLAAEHVVRDLAGRGLPVTIVRPAAIWGLGEPTLVPRLARLLRARVLVHVGPGANRLGLSHVANVVDGLVLAASCPHAVGETYHITDGEEVTQRALLASLAAALGVPAPRGWLPFPVLHGLAAACEAAARAAGRTTAPPLTRIGVRMLGSDCRYAIGKARAQLGYRPAVSFAAGIAELAGHLTKNGLVKNTTTAQHPLP
jgi:nucleoside-diphosphate-sugar epimerase